MSPLLIVIISAKEQFPYANLPKEEGEQIVSVGPNSFFVFTERPASHYATALKAKTKSRLYVLQPAGFLFDGQKMDAETEAALSKARKGESDFMPTSPI